VFGTTPCNSGLPSEASDWLEAQYEARKNKLCRVRVQVPKSANASVALVSFLESSVIFGRKGSGVGCLCWCPVEQMVRNAARGSGKLEA
jgi:hypothetical protein